MRKPFFCSECHKPCAGEEVDFGIGPYEFWGATGVDSCVMEVSECCMGDLLDELEEAE